MKIAFIRQKYSDYGGAERYVGRLAGLLAERGHEVHVLARTWDVRERDGLIFHRIPSLGGPAFIRQPSFAREVAKAVAAETFDLVHSFDRTYSQDIYRAGDGCHVEWLARRARVMGSAKALVDRINPRHKAFLSLEARMFHSPRLKMVLANSRQGREEIIRHYGLPEPMIRVVYNGLDKVRFNPGLAETHRLPTREKLGLTPDEPVALFVGSGFLRKGLTETIRALSFCSVRLVVAGKDDARPCLRLAKHLKVHDRVVFLGPRADLPELYGMADVFVLPSWYEPFSNACLEAMASGLPVVTTRETGAAEVIRNGLNGFTVSFPTPAEELGSRLTEALSLDRRRIAECNQEILKPFEWETNLNQTLAAYDTLRKHSPA